MKDIPDVSKKFEQLRQTAEQLMICRAEKPSEVDPLGLIHELQARHIELSARNEELRRARKTTVEKEKYVLVGKVAGKMAHDFNNILAGIMGSAQIALLRENDDKTRKTLELIVEQAMRGKNLTRNLVAFARDQEPSPEFFPVQEKIDLVLTILKRDLDGIEVVREYDPDLPDLLADPGMIEHGLVNLVHNSIHAVGRTEQPVIVIRAYEKDGMIRIEVEDNGCGIPNEHIDRIYEPAFTLKGSRDVNGWYESGIKGSGYGMANVKKYVELHRGEITIDSKKGVGTKVTLSFPFVEKGLSDREVRQMGEKDFHAEKTILLVEDERTIADIQCNLLTGEPCRHRVDIAETGQDAVEFFDKNEYDCVSLDYVLPGKLNGMDVYQHIREIDKTVPVLFVSGNLEFLESVKALKRKDPYVDHISKPCRNTEYLRSINRLLGRSG